jgi:hypothetical protein
MGERIVQLQQEMDELRRELQRLRDRRLPAPREEETL